MGVANGIETFYMIQLLKRVQRPRPSRWSGTCHPFNLVSDSDFKYPAHFVQNFIDKRSRSKSALQVHKKAELF